MEQSGQFCVPAGLVPGKCPPVPHAMEAGWVTDPVRSLCSTEAALLDSRSAGRIFISWAIPRLHTRLTSLAYVYCYLTFLHACSSLTHTDRAVSGGADVLGVSEGERTGDSVLVLKNQGSGTTATSLEPRYYVWYRIINKYRTSDYTW